MNFVAKKHIVLSFMAGTMITQKHPLRNLKNYIKGDTHKIFVQSGNTNNFYIINPNEEKQFSNADEGILKAFINRIEIDQFNLASAFNESERNGSQSYPPAFGINGKLEILSVQAHNNYPSFQRANFRLNISIGSLQEGENKILISP